MDKKSYQIVEINSATEENSSLLVDFKQADVLQKEMKQLEICQQKIYSRKSKKFEDFILFKGKLQSGFPVGFCFIIDNKGHSYRGFCAQGLKEGFGLSDEIKDHYLKLSFQKDKPQENIYCISKLKQNKQILLQNNQFLVVDEIEYNGVLFKQIKNLEVQQTQDKYLNGEAFIELQRKFLYLSFQNGNLDKSKPGKIYDGNQQLLAEGKLCLGKRDLKGFLYNEKNSQIINLDLKNKIIEEQE